MVMDTNKEAGETERVDPEFITSWIIREHEKNGKDGEEEGPKLLTNSSNISLGDTSFYFRQFLDGYILEIWATIEAVELAAVKVGAVFQFQRPELRAMVDMYRYSARERREWILKAVSRICSFLEQERARQLSVGRLFDFYCEIEESDGWLPMLEYVGFLMRRRWRSWREFGMECSLEQSEELFKFLSKSYEEIKKRSADWRYETGDLLFS